MKLQELKKRSICILDRIVVYNPRFEKEEMWDLSQVRRSCNGMFSANNSTICFVDEELYVTPYTRHAWKTLEDAGLKYRDFIVPFSNGEYPVEEKVKWRRLLKAARDTRDLEYEEDCREWCGEHGIDELPKGILEQCFKMPIQGVPVEHLYFKNVYYPACSETSVDCTVVDKLGSYCGNNGKVVFVNSDGHTYVAKGYEILEALKKAGYKEKGMFVPFSNGELITDPVQVNLWNQVPKK